MWVCSLDGGAVCAPVVMRASALGFGFRWSSSWVAVGLVGKSRGTKQRLLVAQYPDWGVCGGGGAEGCYRQVQAQASGA